MTTTPFMYTIPCADPDNGEPYTETVRAVETDTPGILITEADGADRADGSPHYRLTHRASGMLLTHGTFSMTRDVFGLLTLARDLGTVTDWAQPATTFTIDVGAAAYALIETAPILWVAVASRDAVTRASLKLLGR